jgi:23S rRNA pseudouridine1911/1915/1917 synthase
VAEELGDLSVRAAKGVIERGWVFVNNQRITKGSFSVREGASIEVYLHPRSKRIQLLQDDILWEGRSLIALNKPPGLIVYGTHRVTEDTVLPQLEGLLKEMGRWREGKDNLQLVHRLDRDTSGVLVVARNAESAFAMERQFRQKKVEKRYRVLVMGKPRKERFRQVSVVRAKRPGSGLKEPRARPKSGKKGRESQGPRGVTDFEVLQTFPKCTLLEARPFTGRTHQIRVHLAQVGHPVLGDIVYGPEKCTERLFRAIPRQMLHASFLGVDDPDGRGGLQIEAPLPPDMSQVLSCLEKEDKGQR